MPTPKVSVVINTYNQQDFVRQTPESALTQTGPSIEMNVMDDDPTDNTP